MGFFIMLFSAIIGIILIITGITRKIGNQWRFLMVLLGIIFMALAVWLGMPK